MLAQHRHAQKSCHTELIKAHMCSILSNFKFAKTNWQTNFWIFTTLHALYKSIKTRPFQVEKWKSYFKCILSGSTTRATGCIQDMGSLPSQPLFLSIASF